LGIAVDGNLNVFGASVTNTVLEFTGGTLATTIPGFSNPTGVAVDSSNNLYVADTGNHQIEEFSSLGLLQQPLVIFNNGGNLHSPQGIAVDSSGNIYVADSGANEVFKFAP
jgi:DNA-binding beta-propeller fold protein YncE